MTNEIESKVSVIFIDSVQSVEFRPKGHKQHKEFDRKPTRDEHYYHQNQHFKNLLRNFRTRIKYYRNYNKNSEKYC